ncbi:S-adenosyl-L-methionine-dependent methyltransferase [Macrophomina phaseolina]|uniref:tRNA(Phe) (4-demethylwyosine(37)-C(7)) aminocarboxypropyltransferase n=1 Tax=Macrophomina phaseolina TaxID=35725 RepID=A0ABQ8FPL8_9PEZI|nr:S-adenosyl-L-methionine-dependent methyltransferase [Macrophomina phaseolina]
MKASPGTPDRYALVVPARHVKTVKSFLEEHHILDKRRKIAPYSRLERNNEARSSNQDDEAGKVFAIPILLDIQHTPTDYPKEDEPSLAEHLGRFAPLLESLLSPDSYTSIYITRLTDQSHPRPSSSPQPTNPLRAAFHAALSALPPAILAALSLTPTLLTADLPSTYSIYPPLLLLPAHTFHRPAWTTLTATHPLTSTVFTTLFTHVATHLGVTHIAVNAPIAPSTNHHSSHTTTEAEEPATEPQLKEEEGGGGGGDGGEQQENILRSPTSLHPLHGSFGPRLAPTHAPTPNDFAAAFWCSARQNGIAQTWAPLYTMFSRGNVKEKARVLALPSVHTAIRAGQEGRGQGCAAVDLYAGIGYFAFSYRKAGVRRVLGWEINPWSVEGLRRGAAANGWRVGVVGEGVEGTEGDVERAAREKDLVVFLESNARAAERVEGLRARGAPLPPVRHVNAGLLPSSRGAWETAVRVLDPWLGGWVHLHENFGEGEVGARAAEVVTEVRKIWVGDGEGEDAVRLEHVEKVKTYAPGVLHCVLDIWISPTGSSMPRPDMK